MPAAFRVRALHGGTVTSVDAHSARSFARHSHDEYGVGLVTAGAQRSWSGRGAVEAVRGDLITVNPGEMHDGMPIGGDRAWSMLYLARPLVDRLMADTSVAREFAAPVVAGHRLAPAFLTLRRAGDAAAFEQAAALLLGALFGIAGRADPMPAALRRVRDRIDADPAGDHPLAELARLAGLGRFHTIRAFTRLTGLTPHAYVVQRRLDLVRRAIRGGQTLAGAAIDAGFADQSHMHRAFVARYGATPGAFAAARPQ